jgi:hypothetical protein
MKIGVMFAGFLRTYRALTPTYNAFNNNLFSKYDCDIHYCTWNRIEGGPNHSQRYPDHTVGPLLSEFDKAFLESTGRLTILDIDEYTKNRKEFKIIDREGDVFTVDPRAKEHGEYWVNRIMDQWYMIKAGYNCIPEPEKYDIIFRLRYDSPIFSVNIKNNNSLIIPQDMGGWRFSDHMAYGSPEIMKVYCHLYDEIYNLYLHHNIDVSHAVNMPEFYLTQNNISIEIDRALQYTLWKK